MNQTFTPGPWHVHASERVHRGELRSYETGQMEPYETRTMAYSIQAGKSLGILVADLYPGRTTDRAAPIAEANARLIAAAPDLLAACRAALAHMYDDEIDAPTAAQLTEQLTAAIRLAEGGQR